MVKDKTRERTIEVMDNICRFNGRVWAKVEDSAKLDSGECQSGGG